jgi:FkbM family methyltransferase
MFTFVKRFIRNHPALYRCYTSVRYWRIAKTRNWVLSSLRFVAANDLNAFVFYEDKVFCRVFDDSEFQYHPSILGGLLGMEKKNGFELREIKYLLPKIEPNSVILDVGANFGFYSVILAKKCIGAEIHSFEPVSATFDHLRCNVEHNNVSANVTVNNVGVSEHIGKMRITKDLYAGNHLTTSENLSDTESVDVVTVDHYVTSNSIKKVDFIKCDIEGAELLMLKGAVNTIRRDSPIIFIEIFDEFCQRFGNTSEEVVRFILDFGYSYIILNRDGAVYNKTDDLLADLEKGSDFLFSKS